MSSVKTAYCEYLQTEHGANVYNDFKRLLYSGQDSLVQVLDRDIVDALSLLTRDRLKVCDIGGGDGRRITAILRHIGKQHGAKIDLDFVEQSHFYAQAFRTHPVGAFCNTTVHDMLFEETELPRNAYDLVILIHSIFAFDNGNAVEKVLSLRKRDGKVIVVSNAPNSFLGGLKDVVDVGFCDKRYELDDLELSLARRGVSYYRFGFATEFTLKGGFEGEDTQTLLEWISLGRFSGFSAKQKKAVYDYIAHRLRTSCGRVSFSEEEVALVIPDRS